MMDQGRILDYNFDYVCDPDWAPHGCDIRPWFALDTPGRDPNDQSWNATLRYRPEKVDFVRKQLEGMNRDASLKAIVAKIWEGALSDRERFERIIFFVQRMMLHPPFEQPLTRDVLTSFRRECSPLVSQADAYPEDLGVAWIADAHKEALNCGWEHVGVWCNPVGMRLAGDWGMAGVVWDALELLLLHEGRCGHQAALTVQLAQAGGWRARLLQLNHHRVAELLVDGKWAVADANLWPDGFIGTTDTGELADIDWCLDHLDYVGANWRARAELTGGRGYRSFLELSDLKR